MVKLVKIGSVKGHSRNPRFIRDEKFKKLVASLVEFPEMATLRPLVVDENMTVKTRTSPQSNMRYAKFNSQLRKTSKHMFIQNINFRIRIK
jgi:hypothetical protein